MNPEQWLLLRRIVRFGEVDAAGVMHFHHLLRWSHEVWEESLEAYGLKSSEVFPSSGQKEDYPEVGLPVIHCHADFRKPIKTGDHLEIEILPEKIDLSSFQVRTKYYCEGDYVALGIIRHLAINVQTRKRCALPEYIDLWLEASAVNIGFMPK